MSASKFWYARRKSIPRDVVSNSCVVSLIPLNAFNNPLFNRNRKYTSNCLKLRLHRYMIDVFRDPPTEESRILAIISNRPLCEDLFSSMP
jgi:hypothetical protein